MAIKKATNKNGKRIFTFVTPKDLKAMYSESDDIRPIQKIVEKNILRGSVIGINVIAKSTIIDKMKLISTSDEDISCIILKSSKVKRKITKNIVLTINGNTKFDDK